jgi:hypothetical protein
MLTSDDQAVRTDRAVAAAADAGRDLGLTVTGPRVLYEVFSVVVHLPSAPVVVRVPWSCRARSSRTPTLVGTPL